MQMFKTTKSRLVTATLALLVCVSMFVGSTFAWFTDSVSSVNNIIKSGNLDIEVEYTLDGTTWTALTADASMFDENDLWEPGHTVVGALRIKNVGSLAAKLDVATNVVSEETSINVYDEEFKLSDYLKVYTGSDLSAITAREDVAALLTESAFGASLFAGLTADDLKLLPGESKEVVIGITMPTTVDNVANHKTGVDAPQITFGITVNATQQMYEEDSFGDDYDEDATYPGGAATQAQTNGVAKKLAEAQPGDTVYLEDLNYGALTLSSGAYTYDSYPANITIVGGTFSSFVLGNKVFDGWTFKDVTFTENLTAVNAATVSNLTLDGCTFSGSNFTIIETSGVVNNTITITNCSFLNHKDQDDPSILIQNGQDITVDGCTFVNAGYNAIQTNQMKGEMVFTNNSINGTTDRAIRFANAGANITFTGNTIVSDGDADGELFKSSGTNGTITFDGNTWNGQTDAEVIFDGTVVKNS